MSTCQVGVLGSFSYRTAKAKSHTEKGYHIKDVDPDLIAVTLARNLDSYDKRDR